MTQWLLLTNHDVQKKSISINNISAVFTQLEEKVCEVLLEISSHKFFIKMENTAGAIDNFEIIAAKWYMDIGTKSTKTLKKLVEHLRCRLD